MHAAPGSGADKYSRERNTTNTSATHEIVLEKSISHQHFSFLLHSLTSLRSTTQVPMATAAHLKDKQGIRYIYFKNIPSFIIKKIVRILLIH